MSILKGMGDFFALDIGTSAVRVVQLSGGKGGWSLSHYGYTPVDAKLTSSDSNESRRRLGEIIMTTIGQSGIKVKDVAIGLPSSKTFTTVIEVPNSSDSELRATMKYQIDQYIPMSIDDAKVDWALLGPSLRSQNQQEVLLASTANTYTEDRLEFVESLGLNVVASEPDPIAMIRAVTGKDTQDTLALINMGEQSTDIAIISAGAPRLVRSIPTGLSTLIKAATQNLNVKEDQARQFILKFGLAQDKLDGQVLRAVDTTLDNFTAEIVKSVKFFQGRYTTVTLNTLLLTGFASAVPHLADYIAQKTSMQVAVGDPWQNVSMNQNDQSQLSAVASEFSVAVGLAKRRV